MFALKPQQRGSLFWCEAEEHVVPKLRKRRCCQLVDVIGLLVRANNGSPHKMISVTSCSQRHFRSDKRVRLMRTRQQLRPPVLIQLRVPLCYPNRTIRPGPRLSPCLTPMRQKPKASYKQSNPIVKTAKRRQYPHSRSLDVLEEQTAYRIARQSETRLRNQTASVVMGPGHKEASIQRRVCPQNLTSS